MRISDWSSDVCSSDLSWTPAEITRPDSPYAWYQWTITADLQPATHEIWSRAVDALGRSQPLDGSVFWNPNGRTEEHSSDLQSLMRISYAVLCLKTKTHTYNPLLPALSIYTTPN